MKKLLILLIATILLLPAIAQTQNDEIEVGIALTPMSVLKSEEDAGMDNIRNAESGVLGDNILGLHVGYSFMWLFYASVDANVMPPWWIEKMTSDTDDEGNYIPGIMAPGFITFIDIGVRPTFGPIMAMAEVGINYMYIAKDYVEQLEGATSHKAGMNLRIGAGYKFDMFSVSLIGTSVFPDFSTMSEVLKAAADGENWATQYLSDSIIPSVAFYIHL